MIVIGLMGTIGAGKDVVADYLVKKYGFKSFRSGDINREIAASRGQEEERGILQSIADEMYEKHGKTFFVDEILKRIKKSGAERAIFNGVRKPVDITVPKKELGDNYVPVLVDAKPEIRFERLKKRGRPGFPKTLEEFKKHEDQEYAVFNMRRTFSFPHKTLHNNSTLEELYKQADALVKGLGI
jgi:dephospho-CoA kinase